MKILAAHIVIGAYGFWLPNDPRGSGSEFVASSELLRFGKATKAITPGSITAEAHDRSKRLAAKAALKYPAVRFTGVQARGIGIGFERAVGEGGYLLHACSVLHDHVHLVIAPHSRPYERIVAHLKGRASQELRSQGIHPFQDYSRSDGSIPSPWAESLWKVYCFGSRHLQNAIEYVENNPIREGLRAQRWRFVSDAFRDAPRKRGG